MPFGEHPDFPLVMWMIPYVRPRQNERCNPLQSRDAIQLTATAVLSALILRNPECQVREVLRLHCIQFVLSGLVWWTWTGSNRRPLPCHGSQINHLQTSFLCLHRLTGVNFGPRLDLVTSSMLFRTPN